MAVSKIIFKLGNYLDPSIGGIVVLQSVDDWFEVYVYPKDWEVPPYEGDYIFASHCPKEACRYAEQAYVKEFENVP